MKIRSILVNTLGGMISIGLVKFGLPANAQSATYHSAYVGYDQQGQLRPSLSWESTPTKARTVATQQCFTMGLSQCAEVATVTDGNCIIMGFEWGGDGTSLIEKGPFKAYTGSPKDLPVNTMSLYPSLRSCTNGQVTGGLQPEPNPQGDWQRRLDNIMKWSSPKTGQGDKL